MSVRYAKANGKIKKILQCESCHSRPVEILDYKYKFCSKAPDCIEVRMSDGEILKYYKRCI